MKRIAIFASGNGTNAENIVRHFITSTTISTSLALCNKPSAGVIGRMHSLGVKTMLFSRQDFGDENKMLTLLCDHSIDFIVLAGFLWIIPSYLLQAYPHRIINIHPALLPKYGGKGMYGGKVHELVVQAHEKESGITIHYINDKYDEGSIIFQAKCSLDSSDTAEQVAIKVHQLEYNYYPQIIEQVVSAL